MPKLPFCLYLSMLAALTCPVQAGAAPPETTIDLSPKLATHDLAEVTLELAVGGTLRVRPDSGRSTETKDLPMSVAATLRYDEYRFPPSTGQLATRAVRHYKQADAVIKVDDGGLTPKLSTERRQVVVENPGGRLLHTSPDGILERQELDLIDVAGDSLIVDALLPAGLVAAGDTWSNSSEVMAGLLSLDSVAHCEVESVLDKFNGDFALVRLVGMVVGTTDGAATEMDVRGVYLFDRRLRRVTRCNLAVKETRSIGAATPGLDSVAKLRLDVKTIAKSEHLNEATLAALRAPATTRLDMLRLEAPELGFRIVHDRRWFITSQEREAISMRLVDQGDVIAHATLTSLPPKSAGRQTTLEQFEKDIRHSLGKKFGQLVSSRQWTNDFRHHALEVVVRGTAEEVPVEWHYYLVAPESGQRVSVVVTIDGRMVERLSGSDRQLVNAIELRQTTGRVADATAERSDRSLLVPQK